MFDLAHTQELQSSCHAAIITNTISGLHPIISSLKNLPCLDSETLLFEDNEQCIRKLSDQSINLFLLASQTIDENTLTLYQRIAELRPDIPVVAVGSNLNIDSTRHLIDEGLQEVLTATDLAREEHCKRVIEHAMLRHSREQTLSQYSQKDLLTGLDNRMVFNDRLSQAVLNRKRSNGIVAILILGIDLFKNINESLGHDKGDLLLIKVAERLRRCLREVDTIARLGGDEFGVIIDPGENMCGAVKVAENILKEFQQVFEIAEEELHLTTSIGIAASVNGQIDACSLLKQADAALTKAKKDGRNNAQYFTPELAAGARVRNLIQNSLYRAIKNQEFFMVYQPQIDFSGKNIVGLESLIRWQHPEQGLVAPDVFVPLLEETGLIVEVTDWIIKAASRQRMLWQKQGLIDSNITMAINISARQFIDSSLIESVNSAIDTLGIEPAQLDLELTETYLMDDMDITLQRLKELQEIGVHLSIDDFGTGYSSLSYLKHFPINSIKIDKSFVDNVPADKDDAAIIRAIISLAHNLNYGLVAEGVETKEQLEFLQRLGCESFQGYLFSRPLTAEDASTLLTKSLSNNHSLCPSLGNRRFVNRRLKERRL